MPASSRDGEAALGVGAAQVAHAVPRPQALVAIPNGADLTGAKLDGTLLSGAYLKTARGLTATSLSRAYCDDTTQLPAGLTSAQCRQN